jgi:aspartyl-tRNA(Asn)/glutamyl-tRNA(Gln) amidotransferase subunit A
VTAAPLSIATAQAVQARDGGRCAPWLQAVLKQITAAGAPAHVFTRLLTDDALATAQALDAQHAGAGSTGSPTATTTAVTADKLGVSKRGPFSLRGLPVSVKDLFDIAGQPTPAGSLVHQHATAATQDATAVARLRAAGAVIVGRTTMTEFAYSGVGLNPHVGTPRNPFDAVVARIPGGSSSGAAVSVALGWAVAGLGSDTGGSLRIPAALCGLVGFKPTQARVPRSGAFELSRTLDTVGAITTCVKDAITLDGVLADAVLSLPSTPLHGQRWALPQTVMLDALEPAVARAFERALTRLSQAGVTLIERPLQAFATIAQLNSPGGIVATEAYAVHQATLATHRASVDPRVAMRIDAGRDLRACDYLGLLDRRSAWIAHVEAELVDVDGFLAPTVPMVAPAMQPLIDDDTHFTTTNARLLRNTSVVNYLDGCSISLPCHQADELPIGLMLSTTRGRDAALLATALQVEALLAAKHS